MSIDCRLQENFVDDPDTKVEIRLSNMFSKYQDAGGDVAKITFAKIIRCLFKHSKAHRTKCNGVRDTVFSLNLSYTLPYPFIPYPYYNLYHTLPYPSIPYPYLPHDHHIPPSLPDSPNPISYPTSISCTNQPTFLVPYIVLIPIPVLIYTRHKPNA